MEQYRGFVSRELYRGEDFAVVSFKSINPWIEFVAAGPIPKLGTAGEQLELDGEWTEHPKYGKQFKVKFASRPTTANSEQLKAYLSHHVNGVGPSKAEQLAQYFGKHLQDILEKQPKRLTEVPGISEQIALRIQASWLRSSALKNVEMLLSKMGLNLNWSERVLGALGPDAVKKLEANPYLLTEIRGIGFRTADEAALKLGWQKNAAPRIAAVLLWLVDEAELSGHVLLPDDVLLNQCAGDCDTNREAAEPILDELLNTKKLQAEEVATQAGPVRLIYSPGLYKAESQFAADLKHHSKLSGVKPPPSFWIEAALADYEDQEGIELTGKQREAVESALTHKFSILTGGPGTGKTACCRAVTRLACRRGWRIQLCAPTGRAAKNLEKAAGLPAETIHRTLVFEETKKGWHFARNRSSKLAVDLLVVDEVSMLDQRLASSLMEAVPQSCHVLFIGDSDQLPSVGAGSVLKDLITSGQVPVIRLDKIHRQAEKSLIVTNAYRVLQGLPPAFPPKDPTGKHFADCLFYEAPADGKKEDTAWVTKKIVEVCQKLVPEKLQLDPIHDVQVLAPMRRGACGVEELNTVLQTALNPCGEKITVSGREYRVGDRVMVTRNNPRLDVFNGDVGFLTGYSKVQRYLLLNMQGQKVMFPYENVGDLSLAYAGTVHKAQGSEFPLVILTLLKRHYTMLQRNLLYTAITRARQKLIVVGSRAALEMAAHNTDTQKRYTYLAQRLQNL